MGSATATPRKRLARSHLQEKQECGDLKSYDAEYNKVNLVATQDECELACVHWILNEGEVAAAKIKASHGGET